MSEKNKSDAISRRKMLSLIGFVGALGLSVPPAVLTASDADAQQSDEQPAPKTGTERRQARRTHRVERRTKRRAARKEGPRGAT